MMTENRPEQNSTMLSAIHPLIDTHTHFDDTVFDDDRLSQAAQARAQGVHHLVLVGYVYRHFERLYHTQQRLQSAAPQAPDTHIALGLHPFYIEAHTAQNLAQLDMLITDKRPLAIGEIGLDTYTSAMKQPDVFAKQQRFFIAQLDMAVKHQLPVMLHIRKAHAEALAILKAHAYDAHTLGGIAHSFSGGAQEAKAFVKLGFKLGVTGQVTNPNAKKLRKAIQAAVATYGIECLVIETDCPDMMPMMCQNPAHTASAPQRNVPANLPWVLACLSELLAVPAADLALQLWHNSCHALQVAWPYPPR